MTYQIDVTQTDIDMGVPGSCATCPIARAGARALQAVDIYVSDDWLSYELFDASAYHVALPIEASVFIRRFDDGDAVQPFSFTVEMEP